VRKGRGQIEILALNLVCKVSGKPQINSARVAGVHASSQLRSLL
jgi:hypothetical protein